MYWAGGSPRSKVILIKTRVELGGLRCWFFSDSISQRILLGGRHGRVPGGPENCRHNADPFEHDRQPRRE